MPDVHPPGAPAIFAAEDEEGRGEITPSQGGADPQGGDVLCAETILQVSCGSSACGGYMCMWQVHVTAACAYAVGVYCG